MRKQFNENIEAMYAQMKLTNIGSLKTEINIYLREKYEILQKAPNHSYVWGSNVFETWMNENNQNVEEILKEIKEFITKTIFILRLPIKEHNTLLRANIKYLADLKEQIKNPQGFMTITGLSLDAVNKIIANLALYTEKE